MENGQLDQTIVFWLEKGLFFEALSGESEYFVFDPFYRGQHDILFVVSTMVRWAIKSEKIEFARLKLSEALKRMLEENLLFGLSVLNGYLIITKENKISLNIDVGELAHYAKIGLRRMKNPSPELRHRINSLVGSIASEVDEFKKIK